MKGRLKSRMRSLISQIRSEVPISISLTPLIDTVLVLLVVFFIAAPSYVYQTRSVQLPEISSTDSQVSKEAIQVVVAADGTLSLLDTTQSLAEVLQQKAGSDSETVTLFADKMCLYQTVFRAIDLIEDALYKHDIKGTIVLAGTRPE